MVPGFSRTLNICLVWIFAMTIVIPILMGHTAQPYLASFHIFMGGMIGASWGRGVKASLKWQDYALPGGVLFFLWFIFVLPYLINMGMS